MLNQYKNAIKYDKYCNVKIGKKYRLYEYEDDTIKIVNSYPNEDYRIKIQQKQMFKGIWSPVNPMLNPVELTNEQINELGNSSNVIDISSFIISWAQLEYIKLQLEAIMLEHNLECPN